MCVPTHKIPPCDKIPMCTFFSQKMAISRSHRNKLTRQLLASFSTPLFLPYSYQQKSCLDPWYHPSPEDGQSLYRRLLLCYFVDSGLHDCKPTMPQHGDPGSGGLPCSHTLGWGQVAQQISTEEANQFGYNFFPLVKEFLFLFTQNSAGVPSHHYATLRRVMFMRVCSSYHRLCVYGSYIC